jgi:hypothetical protein
MDRNLPGPEVRLRKGQLWYLFDLAVAAGIFLLVGKIYMDKKGAAVIGAKEKVKAEAEVDSKAGIVQADSVMQVALSSLAQARADSAADYAEYQHKKAVFEAGIADRQQIAANLDQLANQIFSMRDRSQEALQKSQEYEKDVTDRVDEISTLSSSASDAAGVLKTAEEERAEAARTLSDARRVRTYEPVGLFPDRSSLAVRKEVGSDKDLTDFHLQHVFLQKPAGDIGVDLGVGLGSGSWTASKQVGLLFSHPLIHRRLGLDFGAGYSVLTNNDGNNDSGAYASAGLRISPFYKERFHFGVGARAGQGEVLPYVGVVVGRR